MKNEAQIKTAVRNLIEAIGDNPEREGIKDTPLRVAKMWLGFEQERLELKCFKCDGYDEMVILKEVPFYSFCEHHILPFFGIAKIGYIPGEKVVGLSKIGRILDYFALRLQIQERLTMEIANEIWKGLKPKGVGVVLEAEHLCMSMRGIKKAGHKTVTSCLLGVFKEGKVRKEFLGL